MSLLHSIRHRLYQNYLMPDRLEEYRTLLQSIRAAGYEFHTVFQFAKMIKEGGQPTAPLCIWRMDVDSDPAGARRMFDVEQSLGIHTTYYFRLETIDPELMRDIVAYGSEVGYHFEEVATVAKRLGLKSVQQIEAHREDIRAEFARNVERYRDAAGGFPKTIASHGDFLNRKLKISSYWLLDAEILDRFGIFAAVSDRWLASQLRNQITDQPPPHWWLPRPLSEALEEKPPILPVLVHPRQWAKNPLLYTKLDLLRGAEELLYRVRLRKTGR
jgi:hypothetical protein